MNKINLAFFGTSDRAVPLLAALGQNLKLCITKEDTLVGRDQETRETAVKSYAKENNIPFVCIKNIRDSTAEIINNLKKHDIRLGVVADFSFIIPEEIIRAPQYGLMNVHFSLLPLLRGASPIQHAILENMEFTGITFYQMDKGMDTGDILDQIVYQLDGTETSESLNLNLFNLAAQELPRVIDDYVSGSISPQTQDSDEATYCYSITNPKSTLTDKNDALINWQSSAKEVYNMVRAYNPWPIAWTYLRDIENNSTLAETIVLKNTVDKDLRVKIYEAELTQNKQPKLLIINLQIEGKNKMDWKSFVNGYAA